MILSEKRKWKLLPVIVLIATHAMAQQRSQVREQWFHLDPLHDSIAGVSTDRTYKELLKGRIATPVIVAVIDGGVDVTHEDLKNILWINDKEIPGNGLDDDHNGYIDDVNGWNFIGNKNGQNVNHDTYEEVRIYKKLKPVYEGKDRSKLSASKQKEYDLYLRAKNSYENNLMQTAARYQMLNALYDKNKALSETLKTALHTTSLDTAFLAHPPTQDSLLKIQAQSLLATVRRFQSDNADKTLQILNSYVNSFKGQIDSSLSLQNDSRQIVGDNYEKLSEKYYGNPNVAGPDPKHGTHVAGIIAADRTNGNESEGIADHAQIMAVRAVPNGDERDKDIANAIRYAVDNGAKIINMSFGKAYSPEKKAVDKAFRYAESKDVLIVKAAGNNSSNNDTVIHYPSRRDIKGNEFSNVIEVGAIYKNNDENLVAGFSNYGKNSVDVFAPGMQIYATLPGSKYGNLSGTSMASPVVAGIAAVLKSYFPELTAKDLKRIILTSAIPYHLQVIKPNSESLVDFSELSRTGAVVNLYEAVKMALKEKGNL
jgi:subtilisin family serine protease